MDLENLPLKSKSQIDYLRPSAKNCKEGYERRKRADDEKKESDIGPCNSVKTTLRALLKIEGFSKGVIQDAWEKCRCCSGEKPYVWEIYERIS